MATVQQPSAKPNGTPKYESFVEQQLGRARQRLRGLDIAAGCLVLASFILGYGLTVSVADRVWGLAQGIRLAAWCVFVGAVVAYVIIAVRRLVFRNVNPQFLARRLEQTIPDAKNSVINWLDLRGEQLAPVIRGSLGRRAAKDLAHADAERAISAKPLWWFGGIAALLLVAQIGWLLAAPSQVLSLLQRAFLPFDTAKIAARTELTLLSPDGGNTAVLANLPVHFRVQAQGYLPPLNQKGSLRLHFRYHQNEPHEERPLARDVDGAWTTTVLADQVRNGFWYKITGGDAVLPTEGEYRVEVRANPQVLRFEAVLKYREYLRVKDKTVIFDKNGRPSIKELRGTNLVLTLRTNRVLEQCLLELKAGNTKKELAGEAVPGDPESWRFNWVLDQSGEFRILFRSKDGEDNVDRQASKIEVMPDRAPEVVLTKPGQDISLPANATLMVQGQASDDFGVKSMQLVLKPLKPSIMPDLKPKPYRPEFNFQLVNGKYPRRLDYSDFVALDSLRTGDGKPFPLSAGMELEYWLEARDNCDYPDKDGNVGQSKRYKLTITAPETDKNKVAQDQKAAQQQVEEKQQQQNKAMDDQQMQAKAEKQAGQGGTDQQGGNSKEKQELQQKANDVSKALEKQESPGSVKPAEQNNNPGQADQPKDQAGQGKDEGKQGSDKQPPGATKNDGKGDNNLSEAKGGPGDATKDKPGDAKDKSGKADTGQSKDTGDKGGDKPKAEQKGGSSDPKPADASTAKKKDSDPKSGSVDSTNSKIKPGSPDDPSAAKGNQGLDKDAKAATNKAPDDAKNATATTKPGPKDGPTAKEQISGAKGGNPTNETPPADAKFGPPENSQMAGNAKTGDRKDATEADVSKLRDQLMNDPVAREQAKNALEKIGDQANDPKVQQAAEKALEEGKAQPGLAKTSDSQSGTPIPQADNKAQGAAPDQKGGAPATAKTAPPKTDPGTTKPGDGPGKTGPTAKSDPTKQGSGNPGATNKGTIGQDDPGQANPVDESAAARAADLQLETLKKQIDRLRDKLTPEVMKELNWTEKEREDFLRNMMADALLRQEQQKIASDKLAAPGAIPSLLPGSGPRMLQPGPRADPGAIIDDRALPPPEVRDALQIFQKQKK